MNTIQEALTTPIADTCDVLVAGGGFAGIAAAMTDNFSTLDVAALQKKLVDAGVKL